MQTFRKDESGSIIVQATLYIIAIIGFLGLALDGSRLIVTHSNLQEIADAAALAAAKQLDGQSTAISRAITAANSLSYDANNNPNGNRVFWADNSDVYISSVTVSATLGGSALAANTSNDKIARYVKVTTGTWGVLPTFVSYFNQNTDNATAAATAVSDTAFCFPASMMLCNPQETAASTGNASEFTATAGQQFIFSTTGSTGGFSPGVFNLLDDNGDGSDPAIKKLLSRQSAGACVTGGVGPATGQKTNATIDGINVRFGISPQGNTAGMDLSGAPVKIDGLVANGGGGGPKCNYNQFTQDTPSPYSNCAAGGVSCSLPRDPSFTAVGGSGGSHIGSGVASADLQTYWTNQHGGTIPSGLTTRYQVYSYEVANASTLTWNNQSLEQYAPSNSCVSGISAAGKLRRMLHVAVVDCQYWGVTGNSFNNIRLNKYADFFLTEASDGNIYTEFVQTNQIDGPQSGLHSIVRLVQ